MIQKGLSTVKNSFPLVMKRTAVITAIATMALAILFCTLQHDWLLTAAISFGTTCYHFSMRLLIGSLIPPIHRDYSWFHPRKWEQKLYAFLRVKHWKQHLPTYDPSQFSLKDNSLEQVVANMRRAELVHVVIVLCSFLPLLSVPWLGAFPVFFITSLLAALFDSLFVIAQRYNRPRLTRILAKKGGCARE